VALLLYLPDMGEHKQQAMTFYGENEQGFVISVLLCIVGMINASTGLKIWLSVLKVLVVFNLLPFPIPYTWVSHLFLHIINSLLHY
jgi:hypothetical protein